MTNKPHLTRCATLAIAATLALGSTPLLAQDAAVPAPAPVIVVPDVTAAPPPAPTVVVPDVPEAAAPAPRQTVRTAPRAATPAQTRAPAPRPAAAAPAPEPAAPVDTAADTTPADVAPIEQAPVAAAPAPVPEPAPTPEQTRGIDNTMAIALGILAALALMLIGFLALRRKGVKRYAAERRVAQPAVARGEPAKPLVELGAPEFPGGLDPQPALAQSNVSYSGATFGAAPRQSGGGLSHTGAAVALPREAPKSFEEREALIERMVDAAPDRANPFRSRRARIKRARLILGSLGRDFKNADPWIDLSQYPSNWPELARRQSAAA